MHDNPPRPPLLQRMPPGAWTVLTWCAVAGVALMLYATMTHDTAPLIAGLTIAMALPLAWARRRPSPVLAVMLAELVAATALQQPAVRIWPLLLAADSMVCFITATRSRRAGITAAAVTLAVQEAVWQLVQWSRDGQDRVFAPAFLTLTTLIALTVLVAWMVGASIRQRREYGEALRAQAAVQAVTAERLRIARELHDMVAHSIGIIAIQAGAGSRMIDTQPAQARDALSAIETTSRETLKGLRRMLGVLRQPESEPVESAPFAGLADIDRLAATTTAAGVHVDVRQRGERRPLPTGIDQSAFRIIQESVTNVVRHARTRNCRVSIDYRSEELDIEVVDDGNGDAAPDGSGYGIAGMRERVALLNGHFSAGSRPEGGFRVSARLPVPAQAP
ncbi:sensor histidine kinase [Sphaerisporangium perillae]|uniref:sensor histidine kinase n=1 Tax=Sphaerisporangium perillae TaxID=2935860 RepID=UPI00200DB26C|nr:sensor histidine kinase [Sphaerisporangium perillae]